MASISLQGTEFSLSLLPVKKWDGHSARVKISVRNEYVSYEDEGNLFSVEEAERFLVSASRLLAGGYEREYSLSFEDAGIAVDFYAYTEDGRPVSRAERREKDCVAAIRFLMRSQDESSFLGGVYSLLLHREEIEKFTSLLWEEFAKNYAQRVHGWGKYRFAGVSPLGYTGCNYLYFDPRKLAKEGGYVWVRMGRHETEQIVFVDSVRKYGDEDVPYDPQTVKRVLRAATKEEIESL